VVVVVVGAIKGVGYLGQFYFVGLFGQQVVKDLRRQVFERLLALSPGQRARLLTGDLLSRFTADVAAVEQAATYTVASWLRDTLQIADPRGGRGRALLEARAADPDRGADRGRSCVDGSPAR
jgi:subfamily B ATP-binding cassette protein MsbA